MSIEKFDRYNPSISGEIIPYVQVPRDVLQKIDFPEAGFVWVYLLSLPKDWKVVKEHLKNKFKFGNAKIKKIFSYLHMCNLITYSVQRCANGQITAHDIKVLIGNKFKEMSKEEAACTTGSIINPVENQAPGFGLLQIKQTTNETKKQKISCASVDARAPALVINMLFETFWREYPRKVNKKRAAAIWKRMKLDNISEKIISNVKRRITDDLQWQDVQFIPHPSTYLNGERWEDEPSPKKVVQIAQKPMVSKKQETPFAGVTTQSTSWVSPDEALERDRQYHKERFEDNSEPKGIGSYARRIFGQ